MTLLKKYWILLLGVFVILILVLFVFDLGINSNYFIKRDFSKAFTFRITGDCQAFQKYTDIKPDDWLQRCENEKKHIEGPIESFKILNISHNLFSNKAFLQIEITRYNLITEKMDTYPASYDLRDTGITWKIDVFN